MRRLLLTFLVLGQFSASHSAAPAAGPLWEQLVPRKRVEADAQADYTLSEQQGPWLVLAASFSGPAGENQARELVLELRRDFHLPAYYYGMTFQLDDANPGRGIDSDGARIRRRYKRGDRVVQHAVLVGQFLAIDDPEAQQLLKKIKRVMPPKRASPVSSSSRPRRTSRRLSGCSQISFNMKCS